MQMGALRVMPVLGLTLGHDSNITRVSDGEISSFVTVVSPGVRVESGEGASRFFLAYEADLARYADSSIDNYNDHLLSAGFNVEADSRNRFGATASLERGHDARGTGAREGDFFDFEGRDPDEWRQNSLNGTYDFGAEGARGSLGLMAGTRNIEYRNNREYTQFRDRSENYLGGYFGWRIQPKTRALLQVRQTNIEYDVAPPRGRPKLDSTERELFAGLEFDATGKTTGRVLAGRIEKDFDAGVYEDFSGFGWEVGVQFRPRSYSVIDVATRRSTDETNTFLRDVVSGDGSSFILRRDLTAAWTHGWNDRFNTTLDLGTSTDEYEEGTVREDDYTFFGVSAKYAFRPWLAMGAGFKSYSRDSDVPQFEYDRNEVLVTFEGSL
mgnify:CR=1 FL=1